MRLRDRITVGVCCAWLAAGAAHAALPPLPQWARSDGPVATYDDVPPLPASFADDVYGARGREARTATRMLKNPFVSEGSGSLPGSADTQDDGTYAFSASPDRQLPEDGAPFDEDADRDNAPVQRSGMASRAANRESLQTSMLEGPPIPLAAEQRLSTGGPTSSDAGLPPDRPITLDFRHAELGAVLHAFAKFTGLNIVASDRVRGEVTLRFDNVPWRAAFDTLLDLQRLAMERHGNIVWVVPAADLAARERRRFEAHARAAELEPLVSRTFELHYARADELRRLFTGSGAQRVLSKRGTVMADARTNLLFVTDLQGRLDQLAELVRRLDQPSRQVLIEARIVEGEQGLSRNLGVKLAMSARNDAPSTGLHGGTEGTLLNLGASALSGFDAANIGMTLLAARATRLLDVELSALEAEGRGHVVSSPRVVTADRMKAIVEQGTELPYQAKVGQGVSGVQFRRASLKLEVEPRITPDGRVILDLDVAKDSVGEQTTSGPAINTKHVQTRVEVEDGGTVTIGGIDATDERLDVTRVPLLGKIPVLGALFRHRAQRNQRSELVVFITPHVVQTN